MHRFYIINNITFEVLKPKLDAVDWEPLVKDANDTLMHRTQIDSGAIATKYMVTYPGSSDIKATTYNYEFRYNGNMVTFVFTDNNKLSFNVIVMGDLMTIQTDPTWQFVQDIFKEYNPTWIVDESDYEELEADGDLDSSDTVGRTAKWISARTDEPTPAEIVTQIGVCIEEVGELVTNLSKLKGMHYDTAVLIKELHGLGEYLKDSDGEFITKVKNGTIDMDTELAYALLDDLNDIAFTAHASVTRLGYDAAGTYDEVVSSNESKFIDGQPVVLPNGKFGKAFGWKEPNFNRFFV